MNILALDIGERRTGVAFCDTDTNVPVALDTLEHASFLELQEALERLLNERSIEHIVFGLPLLHSGQEGEQAQIVQHFIENFPFPDGISHQLIDERHTSVAPAEVDNDASAACALLQVYLDNRENN